MSAAEMKECQDIVAIMDALPTELVLNVLGFVPYWDLKLSVPLVCKHFRDLVNQKSGAGVVDKALFRDTPRPRPPAPSEEYKAHPLFQNVEMNRHPESVHEILYVHYPKFETGRPGEFIDIVHQIDVAMMDVFNENAVSPAVPRIMLHVRDFPAREVKARDDGAAVSLMDVFQGFVDLLAVADNLSTSYGYPWTRGRALWYDWHSRFKWTGIDEIKVLKGCVHLYIYGKEQASIVQSLG